MTSDESSVKVTKLLIDDPSDFSFHAAYIAYSNAWSNASDQESRNELNNLMLSLKEEGNYSTFYYKLNQYRANMPTKNRISFKAKKKRAWRKSQAKRQRLSRHKK